MVVEGWMDGRPDNAVIHGIMAKYRIMAKQDAASEKQVLTCTVSNTKLGRSSMR